MFRSSQVDENYLLALQTASAYVSSAFLTLIESLICNSGLIVKRTCCEIKLMYSFQISLFSRIGTIYKLKKYYHRTALNSNRSRKI